MLLIGVSKNIKAVDLKHKIKPYHYIIKDFQEVMLEASLIASNILPQLARFFPAIS